MLPTEYAVGFGRAVEERRKRLGWTQRELAATIRSSQQQISEVERGAKNFTIAWAQRVVDAISPGARVEVIIIDPTDDENIC